MAHEFKIGQWVEYEDELYQVSKIKDNGLVNISDWSNDSISYIETTNVKPFELRNGDFVKTEGMKQEQFERIRAKNESTPFPIIKKPSDPSWLIFLENEWLLYQFVASADIAGNRELTIPQVLSLLPVEEAGPEITDHEGKPVKFWGGKSTIEKVRIMADEVKTILEKAPEEAPKAPEVEGIASLLSESGATISVGPKAPDIDWNKPYTTGEEMPCEIVSRTRDYVILQIKDVGAGYDGDQFIVHSKTGIRAAGDYHIINVPEKPREPRFIYMNELPDGRLMHGTTYTEKPDNVWKPVKFVEAMGDDIS